MRRWLQRLQRSGSGPRPGPPVSHRETLELFALEGADAGSQFTIDGTEIRVGRGAKGESRIDVISLADPSIAEEQALIHNGPDGVEIEHVASAGRPTRVNGEAVERAPIHAGDRVQMGDVLFEVRVRTGMTLSGLGRAAAAAATRLDPARPIPTLTTEVRRPPQEEATLVLLRGVPGWEGRRFEVRGPRVRIGRSPEGDVALPEKGVSRDHAELVWDEEGPWLEHKSATNATYLDGEAVTGRQRIQGGETLQLADRVALRIEIEGDVPPAAAPPPAAGAGSLREQMEEKIRRDEAIEEQFGFRGSFLDIDVVDSHGLKVTADRPEHIIVSFERFRNFVSRVVEEHEGEVLNSNGDELMCFFDEPLQSVRAARAVLDRLEGFNKSENLLRNVFRVRQGIHTGSSLMDRERRVAYSPVLDVAGHLQKHAPEDGLLVSAETLAELPEGLPFTSIGPVGREQIPSYRLAGPLD